MAWTSLYSRSAVTLERPDCVFYWRLPVRHPFENCSRCHRKTFQFFQHSHAYYTGTRVPVTSVRAAFYSRCYHCTEQWSILHADRYQAVLQRAATRLQRWWRQCLYSPPCDQWPQGGRRFRAAQECFYGRPARH